MGPAYASMDYARSLAFAGDPVPVAAWGTPVLRRSIPGGGYDAMGLYPISVLRNDADLADGLVQLRQEKAVSVVLVADPLTGPDPARLAEHFTLCRPFKTHHLVDRELGPVTVSKHHADRIRRGERRAAARLVSLREPAWQACWSQLYAGLVERKQLSGLQAFCPAAFARLASLPEECLVAFAAESEAGEVLAMQLWIRDADRAYSHLTASNDAGYKAGATYVLYAAAIRHFADCRWLDFGGGAGFDDDPDDSLASFKRGFSNATRMAHLCGAVLDTAAYRALGGPGDSAYFPAYRAPRA